VAADSPPPVHVPTRAARLLTLMRQGGSMREIVLLRELLDRPVALRPQRWR
jgi:hypothetical protein